MFSRFVDRYSRWIFPLPAVIFILALMVFPIAYTVSNSLTAWSLSAGIPRTFVGLKNYISLFTNDSRFWNAVVQTIYFTAFALVFEMSLGVAMAIFMDARDYPGKRAVNTILLLPMMATPVAVAMVWLLMFEPTAGIINYALLSLHLPISLWLAGSATVIPSLALVDIWEWTPLITLIALAGLTSLPTEPFEAARVDGASTLQVIFRITLPMLMPTLSVAFLLRMIDVLKTFDIIYTMTGGGPGFSSETLNIYTYNQAFYYLNFGYASSMLVIFFALVAGLALLVTYTRGKLEL